VWTMSDAERIRTVRLAPTMMVRLGRDAIAVARILFDYKYTLHGLSTEDPNRGALMSGCHARCAQILRDLCHANGGLYIKFGQHLAVLDYLIPVEYVHVMRKSMLNCAPTSTFESVSKVFLEEFGRPCDEIFAEFEREPIASASLAQVHVAYMRGSRRKLAVKVQHRGLREMAPADIKTVELFVYLVQLAFPDFDYGWLVEEIKRNLPQELDFLHEAENAATVSGNFSIISPHLHGRVVVPVVHADLSTSRILTMDFEEGDEVGDVVALQKKGISAREVSRLVHEAFGEMIFRHGYFHCDPHRANLLIRRGYDGKAVLVLLDSGLYRSLEDKIRLSYAGLWASLVSQNIRDIERFSKELGAGDAYPLFVAMLTTRPWDQITKRSNSTAGGNLSHLAIPSSDMDRDQTFNYVDIYLKDIVGLLGTLPRELLLLLKTNDQVRSLAVELGSGSTVGFVETARIASKALSENDSSVRWWKAFHVSNLMLRLLSTGPCVFKN